jgi:thiol-disulfide isomerase/thioredoxin
MRVFAYAPVYGRALTWRCSRRYTEKVTGIMMRTLALALCLTAGLAAQNLPRPVIDFPITVAGGKLTPTQYKGKVVVVEILLTTCPHCQNSARLLTKLSKEYGPKGLEIVGAAINPNADVPGFIKMTGATFPVGTAPRENVLGFLEQSVMRPNLMMPQLVIVDRKGMVRAQFAGNDPFFQAEEANLRALLDKLIAEGVAAQPAMKKGTKKAS